MKRWLLPETGNFYKANLHLHTKISDGIFTPEEVKRAYMERGYSILAFTDHEIFLPHNDLTDENFLALNAHEIAVDEVIPNGGRFMRTYHLNFYAKSRDTVLSPVFSESRVFWKSTIPLITDEMRKFDARADYSPESINELIRIGNENGFFVTYNHPVWSLQNYPDYIGLEGLWGVEVWNTGCVVEALPDTTVPLDDLLKRGKDVFPICSDDNHVDYDRFGGWTMIKADKLDYDAVIAALLAGNFYSSAGPTLTELTIEDGTLTVVTDDVKCVRAVTDWRAPGTKWFYPERDGDRFVTTVPISRFADKTRRENAPGWQHSYFRLEIIGHDGKNAYTRAFRFTDFPELL